MVTPLVAMAAFVTFGLTRSRFSTPRLADSIYFMGFLWTLWALIDVLVFSEQLRAQDLYNAFGYALIATASGMFIRLALLQFYRTVDDQEDQAVDRMDESVARLDRYVAQLTAELEQTQRTIASLRPEGARILKAWHQEFADAARESVRVLSAAAQKMDTESGHLAEALKDLRTNITPITPTIKALESKVAGASRKLADATEQSGAALQESLRLFQANLVKIERTPESLETHVREIATSLERALAPLNDAASRILKDVDIALVELAKAVLKLPNDERVRETTAKLATELETLRHRSEALAAASELTGGAFSRVTDTAAGLAAALNQSRDNLGRGFTGLTQQAQQLGASLSDAGRSTKQVDVALREVVDFVRTEVSRR